MEWNSIKIIFEIPIGIFAGYCCMYFLTMEFMHMKPQEFIIEWFETMGEKFK